MRKKNIIVIILLLMLSFALLLFPFEMTMAPERSLKVVDANQNPLNGVMVRQIWRQYSLQINGEEEFVTANGGRVVLPKRTVDTNLIKVISGGVKNIFETSIHASLGSYESIGFMKNGYQTIWFHSTMEPLTNNVVTIRRR